MMSLKQIRGMDLSSLPQVEACGGRFYCWPENRQNCDAKYTALEELPLVRRDPLVILREHGMNLVRLRLWNEPRSPEGEPYGGGDTDLTRVVSMARRAKEAGIPWLLDFHYSDFWADPAHQIKPAAWRKLAGADLEQAVYGYTKSVLERLSSENLLPAVVQPGNEVTNGILWPEGRADVLSDEKYAETGVFSGETAESFALLTRLLGAGIRAVRECAPSARVMIHLDNGGNAELYRRWFSLYRACGGEDFDIIGLSYYPFWHGSLEDLRGNMSELAERTGKDLLIAETSYGFTARDYGEYEKLSPDRRCGMAAGAASADQLPWPMSPEGQAAYLRDLAETIDGIPGALGYIYWEPCLLPLPGTGWAEEAGLRYLGETGPGGNGWANQALFDYDGRALPALRSIRRKETGEDMEKDRQLILTVSFGTSFAGSREKTIGGIENAIREAFPGAEVRRAFTSSVIRGILRKRDGILVDSVAEALDRALEDGFRRIIVQPTHLISGIEYEETKETVRAYAERFDEIRFGQPLLSSEEDMRILSQALKQHLSGIKREENASGKTAVLFMGHGTSAEANRIYEKLQEIMREEAGGDFWIGTVEAHPDIDDLISSIQPESYAALILMPLMVVAGDHACNDMAGDDEDSWKSKLTALGYRVVPVLEGLGQIPEVQRIYVRHVEEADGR